MQPIGNPQSPPRVCGFSHRWKYSPAYTAEIGRLERQRLYFTASLKQMAPSRAIRKDNEWEPRVLCRSHWNMLHRSVLHTLLSCSSRLPNAVRVFVAMAIVQVYEKHSRPQLCLSFLVRVRCSIHLLARIINIGSNIKIQFNSCAYKFWNWTRNVNRCKIWIFHSE